uniref:Uncharacterized protein n=1 Tax=Anopheles christyi TaxID=43041 RepID=A0A182KJ65_9DIPT
STTTAARIWPLDYVLFVSRNVRYRYLSSLPRTIPCRPPLLLVLADNVQYLTLLERQIVRITAIEIELSDHLLEPAYHRPAQRCRIEIVQLVKRQQIRQVGERLVTDPVHKALIRGWYFVDNVVAHFRVFAHTQHEIPHNGRTVAHQKYATFALVQ